MCNQRNTELGLPIAPRSSPATYCPRPIRGVARKSPGDMAESSARSRRTQPKQGILFLQPAASKPQVARARLLTSTKWCLSWKLTPQQHIRPSAFTGSKSTSSKYRADTRTRPVEDGVIHKHPVHVIAVQVEEPCRLRPAVAQRQLRAHTRVHSILVQGVVRAAVQVPGAGNPAFSLPPIFGLLLPTGLASSGTTIRRALHRTLVVLVCAAGVSQH